MLRFVALVTIFSGIIAVLVWMMGRVRRNEGACHGGGYEESRPW